MLASVTQHIEQQLHSIGMFWYSLRNNYSFFCHHLGKSHKKLNFALLSLDVVLAFGFAIGNFNSTQFLNQKDLWHISENKGFFQHQYLDGDGMRHLSLGALWLSTTTTSKFALMSSLYWSPYSSYL